MEKDPQCIGIILDGNRRWARQNNLSIAEGHLRGYERLIDCARWVRDRAVPHLVVYAFSIENWNREKDEVSYLMNLLKKLADEPLRRLADENIRVRFIGKLDMLSREMRDGLAKAESARVENPQLTLWVCLSYGSRQEITAAAQTVAQNGGKITEESLRKHFWSAEMPDPDLIIRPGGEKRLSNFLLWQAAYSELFFIDPYWPEFSETALDQILSEYKTRERRVGV